MRVLFIQQDHMSPAGPAGEASAGHGFGVQEFVVAPEEPFRARARRLVAAFIALGGSV
jgi:hypothetical protein